MMYAADLLGAPNLTPGVRAYAAQLFNYVSKPCGPCVPSTFFSFLLPSRACLGTCMSMHELLMHAQMN